MNPTAATIIRSGIIIGTHNGTIYNANYLFRRLGLPRYAEVDSELLVRLADRFAPDGTIDGRGFRKALCLCRCQMNAVLPSRLDPGAITVIKGNIYKRVLVAVETNDLIRSVWLYNYNIGHNTERIASGRWYPSE
ncbi:hypothetical protein [Desulfamplus magnetovallimortis]|uniref:hypothetical protein n=1 Tax=Desulfamplus magnetovallimortis TaxID=1246637 RepID=UPI001FE8771B|nr:hypothetical protein [Desulfamplus magnetovallimortis]